MKLEDLDFDTVSTEKLKMLENVKEMVLSTCCGSHVTSRVVSTACQGRTIIFTSWGHNTKCVQIRENPNVAICIDNIQIEGVATLRGDPRGENNSGLMSLYKEKQEAYHNIVLKVEGMELVEITITRMACYTLNTWFIERIDFEKRTACRDTIQKD
jgi:general stress protein 26